MDVTTSHVYMYPSNNMDYLSINLAYILPFVYFTQSSQENINIKIERAPSNPSVLTFVVK